MKLALLAVAYVIGLFAAAALILTVRDWLIRRAPPSPDEQRAAAAAWNEQLLAPDWRAVEQQLGRRTPAVLRGLYADHALLLSTPLTVIGPPGGLDAEWHIDAFYPAEGRASTFRVPAGAFCFATTVFGDPYYVELGQHGDDGPVFVHYHDGGDTVRIANTLAEFLSWPRRPERPHPEAEA